MARPSLRRLLARDEGASRLLVLVGRGEAVHVADAAGGTLAGRPPPPGVARAAIEARGRVVGWVDAEHPAAAKALLEHLLELEAQKKDLAGEVLGRYRELNLIYNLTEKLGASLELSAVARTVLDEAMRLVAATGGAVLLLDERARRLQVACARGRGGPRGDVALGEGVVGAVAQSGHPEVVTDLAADPRAAPGERELRSLLCAPLAGQERRLGVICLVADEGPPATAGDLKLLSAVASLAAAAIERARLHAEVLAQMRAREEQLRRQVESLRVELDEARQERGVSEVTETDYFQRLRGQAAALRRIIDQGE